MDTSKEWDPTSDIPDLTGKTALVTGANSPTGLGFNIAVFLALRGAKTYVGARTAAKAEEGIEKMKEMFPSLRDSGLLKSFVVDLGNLRLVKLVGRAFANTEARLDILVHNAAVVPGPEDLKLNEFGILNPFSINHLAPFILTEELLPLIKRTAIVAPGVRVVTMASEAHSWLTANVRFDTLESFNQNLENGMARYGLSKLANILFSKELQGIFNRDKISAVSLSIHPGGVQTDGALGYVTSIGKPELLEGSSTPAIGALTPLFAATSPLVWENKDQYGGAYLTPYGVISTPSKSAQDKELAKSLWKLSEELASQVF